MRKKLILTGLALVLAALLGCAGLLIQQRALAAKLIRFHVVADSDAEADQSNKLAVRDALLDTLAPMAKRTQTRAEMLHVLRDSLPQLKAQAEQTLRRLGCADAVEVTLGREIYPTRVYETFSLPAGPYTSLQVRIGSARGHNWWCVCFPTLCQSACAEDLDFSADGESQGGFSEILKRAKLLNGKDPDETDDGGGRERSDDK